MLNAQNAIHRDVFHVLVDIIQIKPQEIACCVIEHVEHVQMEQQDVMIVILMCFTISTEIVNLVMKNQYVHFVQMDLHVKHAEVDIILHRIMIVFFVIRLVYYVEMEQLKIVCDAILTGI